jgi:hypothetical protein
MLHERVCASEREHGTIHIHFVSEQGLELLRLALRL